MRGLTVTTVLVAVLAAPSPGEGDVPGPDCTLRGRCVEIASGDTLIVEIPEGRVRLRLAGVRAPVEGQATFERSRVRMVEMAYLRDLCVRAIAAAEDGTLVGTAATGEMDLGRAQLEGGFAWFDATTDPGDDLAAVAEAARGSHAGLWARREPESPWDYEARIARMTAASRPTPTPSLVQLAGRTRFADPADRRIVMVSTPSPTATPAGGEATVTLSLGELLAALDAAVASPSPTPTPG